MNTDRIIETLQRHHSTITSPMFVYTLNSMRALMAISPTITARVIDNNHFVIIEE